eukprot:m.167477 g.167477  ORF g.167477 m.167477 type:complete len:448 (-) comp24102_c0_seq11:162-1505(-)
MMIMARIAIRVWLVATLSSACILSAAASVIDSEVCEPFAGRGPGTHTLGSAMAPSEWERLNDSELSTYFTADEVLGITRMSCGPLHSVVHHSDGTDGQTTRWISGQAAKSPDFVGDPRRHVSYFGGPCCPNGHTYGWFGSEASTTEALRRVEVVNGLRTRPFRMKRLLHCLRNLCGRGISRPARQKIIVWIQGDSTQSQFYFALLCGLIRIGATVTNCTFHKGHIGHRGCTVGPSKNSTFLPMWAALQLGNIDVKLVLLGDTAFATPVKRAALLTYCEALSECPTLVIANTGLHVNYRSFEKHITPVITAIYDLPPRIRSRVIWKQTTIQHFPTVGGHGLFETKMRNMTSCVPRVNASTPRKKEMNVYHRQHQSHIAIMRLAKERGLPPLPYLSLDGVELNTGDVYSDPTFNTETDIYNLDCTHHLYTPLYWDAVFDRVANVLCGIQ